ncbi:MAG: hypothetical protein RXR82_00350 [Nitrososphaeria archaeon]
MSVSVRVSGSAALISATAATYYALSVSSTPVGGGTTSPSGANSYPAGATVQVTAKPVSGYCLSYWLLDGVNVGNSNPITVTMNQPHELVAVFALCSGSGGVGPASGGAVLASESIGSPTPASGGAVLASESIGSPTPASGGAITLSETAISESVGTV